LGPPSEFRSLFFEIPGIRAGQVKATRSRDGIIKRPQFRVEYTPLSAAGSAIPTPATPPEPPSPDLETRQWQRPAKPARGRCEIETGRFRGLVATGGAVIAVLRPLRGVPGDPYLTCSTTAYTYNGVSGLEARVLIDASHPRSYAPSMPGVEPAPGRPGAYQSLPWITQAFVARRVGRVWLLVTGGTGLQQRLSLLSDLRVRLHLGRGSLMG
jgi:hypothetical protein